MALSSKDIQDRFNALKDYRRHYQPLSENSDRVSLETQLKINALVASGYNEALFMRGDRSLSGFLADLKDTFKFTLYWGQIPTLLNNLANRLSAMPPNVKIKPRIASAIQDTYATQLTRLMENILDDNDFYPNLLESFNRELITYGYAAWYVRAYYDPAVNGYRFKIEVPKSPLLWFDLEDDDPVDIFIGQVMPLERAEYLYDVKEEASPSLLGPWALSGTNKSSKKALILEYFRKAKVNDRTGELLKPGVYQMFYVSGDGTLKPIMRGRYWVDVLPVSIIPYIPRPVTPLIGLSFPELAKQLGAVMLLLTSVVVHTALSIAPTFIFYDEHAVDGNRLKTGLFPLTAIPYDSMRSQSTRPIDVSRVQTVPPELVNLIQIFGSELRDLANVQMVDLGRSYASDPASKVRFLKSVSDQILVGVARRIESAIEKVFRIVIRTLYSQAVNSIDGKVDLVYYGITDLTEEMLRDATYQINVDIGSEMFMERTAVMSVLFENALKILQTTPDHPDASALVRGIMDRLGIPRTGLQPDDELELIYQENAKLLAGQPVPIKITDNHVLHLQEHSRLMKSADFDDLSREVRAAIQMHIASHAQKLELLREEAQQTIAREGQSNMEGLNGRQGETESNRTGRPEQQ